MATWTRRAASVALRGTAVWHHFEEGVRFDEASFWHRSHHERRLADLTQVIGRAICPQPWGARLRMNEVRVTKMFQTRYTHAYVISRLDPVALEDLLVVLVPLEVPMQHLSGTSTAVELSAL